MTIFGTDMSHYDIPASDLGERLVKEKFAFATHKAGGDANDAEIGAFWSAVKGVAKAGKLLVGAYWVLYPGTPTTRANAFCDRLDATCPGWGDVPFILQVDCEIWGGNRATLPTRAEITAFCDRLRQRAPKLMPIVYGPEWCYGDKLAGLGYPLWASRYVDGAGAASALYPGDGSSKWGAYSGQTPEILQFTSSATIAGQTTCDANAYRGTLAQLTKLVAPGWTTEEVDVELDDADATLVAKKNWQIDGLIKAPAGSLNADGTPNEYWSPATHAYWNYMETVHARDAAKANGEAIAALAAQVSALAAKVAQPVDVPALASAIVAALPTTPGQAPTAEAIAAATVSLLDAKLSS